MAWELALRWARLPSLTRFAQTARWAARAASDATRTRTELRLSAERVRRASRALDDDALARVLFGSLDAAAQRLDALEELELLGCEALTDVTLSRVGHAAPQLTALNVSGCRRLCLAPDVLGASLRAWPRLRCLRLSACQRVASAHVEAIAAAAPPGLRTLDLSGCSVTISSAAIATLARACPALTAVSLRGLSRLTDAAPRALLINCPRLRALDLHGCDAIALDEATILTPPDDLPAPATAGCALEYFAFSCGRNRGPPSGRLARIIGRAPAPALGRLRHVSVSGCEHFGHDDFHALAAVCGAGLRWLDAACTRIDPSSLLMLMGQARGLRRISLAACDRLNAFVVRTLTLSCAELRHLTLDANDWLTDAALLSIGPHSRLRFLSARQCARLTETAARNVRDAPQLISLDLRDCPAAARAAEFARPRLVTLNGRRRARGEEQPAAARGRDGKLALSESASTQRTRCTACVLGGMFVKQPMYECVSCGLVGGASICGACAWTCHRNCGDGLRWVGVAEHTCDCVYLCCRADCDLEQLAPARAPAHRAESQLRWPG